MNISLRSDSLGKTMVIVSVLGYVMGLFIFNSYLDLYGLKEFNAFRAQYVLIGLPYLFFVACIGVEVALLLTIVGFGKDDGAGFSGRPSMADKFIGTFYKKKSSVFAMVFIWVLAKFVLYIFLDRCPELRIQVLAWVIGSEFLVTFFIFMMPQIHWSDLIGTEPKMVGSIFLAAISLLGLPLGPAREGKPAGPTPIRGLGPRNAPVNGAPMVTVVALRMIPQRSAQVIN
jgi:hypothetical protein